MRKICQTNKDQGCWGRGAGKAGFSHREAPEAVNERITEANISRLVAGFDLIVDATDSLPARYLLNKAALAANTPFFHGAVYGFEGRATTKIPGKTAC